MVRRVELAIFITLLLAATACFAFGAPSFRGYTGLVKIPTANTLNGGEYDFGVMTEDTAKANANDIFLTYSPRDDVEVGINSFQPLNSQKRKPLLNAKYQFLHSNKKTPSVAIGVIDLANEYDGTAYVVASKSILRRANIFHSVVTSIRGNAGFGVGNLNGMFAGLSIYAGNRVMFSVEWDSEDVNLGFRFTPVKGLRLNTAILDFGNRDDYGIGMSFAKAY